ncbi:hypothetical protein D9615_005900 [Tricholomella constricta]|uniref:N-acetyltransferase domain-containing protein n=1 Tax=Tricholomella constricta TaxID=117010 RepID=A0A8H5M3E6_9AGAR|nr:hypothetical protein D9615_005900 [Tricholomella constricta]
MSASRQISIHYSRNTTSGCDEELQHLTASVLLSLDAEYEMQPPLGQESGALTTTSSPSSYSRTLGETITGTPGPADTDTLSPTDPATAALPMIGDVNIFLKGAIPIAKFDPPQPSHRLSSNADDDEKKREEEEEDEFEAEVEVMIAGTAEPAYHRKGLGHEALQLLLEYATSAPRSTSTNPNTTARTNTYITTDTISPASNSPPIFRGKDKGLGLGLRLDIPLTALVMRIGDSNVPSIRLFKMRGFRITRRAQVFEEVEMRWSAAA